MAYLGNRPAESFASFEKQVFTIVNSQTAYTLSHSVVNENDIRLVVNSVVQEPGSGKAYTASGTTLTLSAALVNGTDTMYCVFLGRALQTVNAPNASVGSSQTAPTIITGQTAEATVATDDTILIHDTSASALRKMTRANFVSGIGGANTPYFQAVQSTDVGLTDNTAVVIPFNSEPFDSGSLFNNSNGRFVMDSTNAGKYFIYAKVSIDSDSTYTSSGNFMEIKLNHYNSSDSSLFDHSARSSFAMCHYPTVQVGGFFNLANGDYVNVTLKVTASSLNAFGVNTTSPSKLEFTGFKIIE